MMKFKIFLCLFFCLTSAIRAQQLSFAGKIGGSQFENAMGIAADSTGHVIVCGYFSGMIDADPGATAHMLNSNGGNDIFLARFDSAGNYINAINIGGQGEEFTYADPVIDNSGNIYICGVFENQTEFNPLGASFMLINQGMADGFIACYDSTLNLLWARAMGGTGVDEIYRIDLKNNVILFAGSFSGQAWLDNGINTTPLTGSGMTDGVFGKFDINGSLLWVKTINSFNNIHLYQITANHNGQTYITGTFNDTLVFNAPQQDTLFADGFASFIAAFNSSGNYLWAFKIENAFPFGLYLDHQENILTCGQFSGIVDFDPDNDTLALIAQGTFDGYFAKYNSNGNMIFANRIGGGGLDVAYAIKELQDYSILLTGFYFNTADFDPDITVASLNSNGFADLFVATYDSMGAYRSVFGCGGPGFDFVRNVAVTNNNAILIAGGFEQTVDFNPSPSINALSSSGSRDGFFAKYFMPVATTFSHNDLSLIAVYPNPFSNYFTVNASNQDINITLTDIMGKVILSDQIYHNTKHYFTNDLKPGVYLISLNSKNKSFNCKIIKQ
jgi:hypothetical protein